MLTTFMDAFNQACGMISLGDFMHYVAVGNYLGTIGDLVFNYSMIL